MQTIQKIVENITPLTPRKRTSRMLSARFETVSTIGR